MFPRSIVISTDDTVVRKQLRDLDQPMCFFGEGPAERRARLAKVLEKLTPEERAKVQASEIKTIRDKEQDEIFYYEGSEALKRIRYRLVDHSFRECSARLDMARIRQLEPFSTRIIPQQDCVEKIRRIEDCGSYVDEETTGLKTLTCCNFNPEATLIATSCRSGRCKLWSVTATDDGADYNQVDLDTHIVLKGHTAYATYITFSPKSGPEISPNAANLASCAMDGSVTMWNLTDESPTCQLSGPQNWRVTRVQYHPCGDYLASCCSDKSWRLWDLETQTEVLHQEGHSDGVFDISFHPDGSLAGTAGLDSYSRIWDLRTGRSIQFFEGHTSGIRTVDFSTNGYHMATGSMDNTVKIWNLRQRKLEYTIPAHLSAVTTVMFEKENGFYLATASFDKTVKFWSSQTWAPIKTLDAFEDKVPRLDLSRNSDYMVSCHSMNLSLWSTK